MSKRSAPAKGNPRRRRPKADGWVPVDGSPATKEQIEAAGIDPGTIRRVFIPPAGTFTAKIKGLAEDALVIKFDASMPCRPGTFGMVETNDGRVAFGKICFWKRGKMLGIEAVDRKTRAAVVRRDEVARTATAVGISIDLVNYPLSRKTSAVIRAMSRQLIGQTMQTAFASHRRITKPASTVDATTTMRKAA